MKRVLTALVLVPFALSTIFLGSQWYFAAVVFAMAALCYHEFTGIARGHGIMGPLWIGYLAGVVLLWNPEPLRLIVLVLLCAALGIREMSQVLPFAGGVLLGVVYIFGAWRCAIDLRSINAYWVLYALAINWAGDIAALYIGRLIGRHKLAPRISPGKSWEGAIGSVLAAIVFGLVFQRGFSVDMPLATMTLLSVIANAAGQAGDLAESALKRGAGLKDSGTLLPGHGGFLDRLDSSLFTLPVVYYFLLYRF